MRRVINLNNDWAFIQQDAGLPEVMPTDWQTVSLPHTWNAIDGHDGNGGYDKGRYWYAKTFATPKSAIGRRKSICGISGSGTAGDCLCKRKRSGIS